ncbi:DUF3833 domain-containing protein [Pseudoalteromonas tunicata]|uniref:DUF3833 domain-containing protein n=1 Tax=Pseudoalteromonas tunicata TaxID=314281 RepID=UPI00273D95C0|nr:DUF3833 domain-containing protein [Pseudoalteromonas tunicata]MDP4984795.1 DUF3833 domain-containing protein [Pseudoalteromonas tunicata]MDP5214158.1 DUF3833 domain-containing protein [Pseudoalteromonas tunicata]
MRFLLVIFSLLVLTACSNPTINDYQNTEPKLELDQFFNGKLKAYGLVLDRQGLVTRRFEVDLIGSWHNNHGELNEWFYFDDGEKSTRNWKLTKLADGNYTGTAGDVVGIAKGKTAGSALYWKYQLLIKYQGDDYEITLDDWMYLVDDKRLFNKTELSKFGFKVGEVILYIEKISS